MQKHENRIKEAREAHGWSQEKLAEMVGTYQQSIQRYESGDSDLKASLLVKLSNVLDVSISYLLVLDEKETERNVIKTNEQRLLDSYRSCTPDRQGQILALAGDLAALSKNTAQRDPLPEGAVA